MLPTCALRIISISVQVWQAWQVVAPVKPQLYLSSQADALIPPAEISLFMKQQVRVYITSKKD